MNILLAEANDGKMRKRPPGFLYGSDRFGTVEATRVGSVLGGETPAAVTRIGARSPAPHSLRRPQSRDSGP
jgi:hypothetical protein